MKLLQVLTLLTVPSMLAQNHQCPVEQLLSLHADCSNSSLQEIPSKLLNSTDRLILDHNNISFEGGELQRFGRMTVLSLVGNNIYSLSRAVFSGLGQLKKLILSNNNLEDLPHDVFSELLKLEELYLDHNNLYCLDDRLFSKLFNIQFIDISHNNLQFLNGKVLFEPLYDNLVTLDASHNNLRLLSMPTSMYELRSINVSYNILQHLNVIYGGELELVDFSHNNITKILLSFFSYELKVLNLSHNLINSIIIEPSDDSGDFTVDNLLVSDCKLTRINVALFSITRRYLDLSDNRLTTIYRHDGYPSLPFFVQNVSFANNPFLYVPVDVIKGFKELRQLDLSGTSTGPQNFTLIDEIIKLPNLILFRITCCEICEFFPSNILARYFNISERVAVECSDSKGVSDSAINTSQIFTQLEIGHIKTERENLTGICSSGSSMPQPLPCPDLCYCTIDEDDEGPVLDCTNANIDAIMPLHVNYTNIKMQYNKIEFVDRTSFSDQVNLYFLNMSHNRIQTLPEDVFQLFNVIQELDLSYNLLTQLPENVFKNLTALILLSLEGNSFTFISDTIFETLQNLFELRLGFNINLEIMSSGSFNTLTKVERLFITHSGLQTIQTSTFRNVSSLKRLSLDHNQLHNIENGLLSNLHKLESLDLSNNLIETIGNESFIGTHIEYLYLTNNELKMLHLNYLENLIECILSNNHIKYIKFNNTHNIIFLHLNNNNLGDLEPTTFSGLNRLRVLDLSNNPLCDIQTDLFLNVSKLGYLNLANTSLTSLPAGVFSSLKLLERLILDDNNFKSLTIADVSSLEYLRVLSISRRRDETVGEGTSLSYKNMTLINYFYNNPHLVILNLTGHQICQQLEHDYIIKYIFTPSISLIDVCSNDKYTGNLLFR